MAIAGSGDIKANNISCTNNLEISVAGSGDILCSDIACTNLKASVAGSGDIKLKNIVAINTQASVAGSGTAELTGTTQEATYSVAGSGDLYASDFQAKRASANVTGSGDIKCHVTEFLKVRTSEMCIRDSSLPTRLPMFFTSTVKVSTSSAVKSGLLTLKLLYAKVV